MTFDPIREGDEPIRAGSRWPPRVVQRTDVALYYYRTYRVYGTGNGTVRRVRVGIPTAKYGSLEIAF